MDAIDKALDDAVDALVRANVKPDPDIVIVQPVDDNRDA